MKTLFVSFLISIICSLNIFSQSLDSSQSTSKKLRIVFAGDIMGHLPQTNAAYDSGSGIYNFEPVFRYVKPYIDSADVAIANLEVTLAGKPFMGYPQFSSPDELAHDIKNAGFGTVVMANNHCYDRGKAGFTRTIQILDSVGIKHFGTYLDSIHRAKEYPFILEKNGFRVALLNYTYGTNGILPQQPNIINYISAATIIKDLARAKALKPDFIIAVMHWGAEYQLLPNNDQKYITNVLIKNGCDAIIGSHPHVVQNYELVYPNSADSTRSIPVFYSMGNLVSNQRERYKDGGAMVSLTLSKTDTKKTSVSDFNYMPYWVYRGVLNNKYQYYILPVQLYDCQPDSFRLPVNDSIRIKEFESDIKGQLNNLKISDFFNCK
jgi:poly-gamma-glutamate synthesis protein (capsule biosynthesis protein)